MRKTLGCGVVLAFFAACAVHPPLDLTPPSGYTTQQRIVRQGYTRVATSQGAQPAVFFGYDRNRDMNAGGRWSVNSGVDLLEYKQLSDDGGWDFIPFLIVVDDDFDGVVDRIFVDRIPPAGVDTVYGVHELEMSIDHIDLKIMRPFLSVP